MKKPILKSMLLVSMIAVTSMSNADGFFGNNNRGFGNFFGGNNNGYDCNEWPEWTPMYWMEEMMGNNDCYNRGYPGGYANPYYPSPYQSSAYANNPYMGANPYANPYAQARQPYVYRPIPTLRNYSSYKRPGTSSFSGNRTGTFPNMNFGNSFSRNPFSSFSSPMSSPLSSGFPAMSPLGGLGGFGSPFSPFSSPMTSPMSMGTMGMPGMSPFSSFGGSPFGGSPFGGSSSFMPFR